MNAFGRLFRVSVLGESHGECIGAMVDGCPAGISLSAADLLPDLERRKGGAKGATPRKEDDIPLIKSGVFNGKTTGAPILILFENKNIDSSAYEKLKNTPRPGHADLTASRKYGGFNDYRGGGHFSGRLTVALVAAGAVAKKLLKGVGVEAKLLEAGGSKDIERALEAAMKAGDSIGGLVECRISGLPPGLGEPFFDSAESLLAHAAFSIPAVKAIEFGAGFSCARLHGSECNDEILNSEGKTKTNNAGGVNGGITNGNELVFRVAVKPTASISRPQKTVDLKTGKQAEIKVEGRHDACIALRVPVVLEAAAAITLADLMLLEQKIPRITR
ncbi:Chorismate synthase [uncultured archaeon]|nr:Chorismate synthase [uncultured archaeon]